MQRTRAIVHFIFFGNYFYGFCTIGLSIEASLQQQLPLNPLLYYILLFAVTVLYYTKAYITNATYNTNNKRTLWYIQHKKLVIYSQLLLTLAGIICLGILLKDIWKNVLQMQWQTWFLLLIFPVVAALYYGIENKKLGKYNLRNTGFLKPFVIGFVWGGLVTIYPFLFHTIEKNIPLQIAFINCLLFIKNFMFVTVLCIMFDIKDYAADYNQQLKTFVVRVGLRKTIFLIIIPLCVIGFGTFLVYSTSQGFSLIRILLNAIPFILLLIVAYSLHRRQSILYYLIIIDGLMLVKAIFGTIATIYF